MSIPIFNNQIYDCFSLDSYKISIDPGEYITFITVYRWEPEGLYPFTDPTPVYTFRHYNPEAIEGWRKVFIPLIWYTNWSSKRKIWKKIWEEELRIASLRQDVARKHLERVYGDID